MKPLRLWLTGIGAALIVAFGLRMVALDTRPLWYDEAFAILFAEQGLDRMIYGTLTPVDGGAADIHPLLYYTTLNGWMNLVGDGAGAVRFWSVLLGVATVGMMYLLGRDLFAHRSVGLAAAWVTALAPFHVQYSQEARMYSLLGLLLMTATWALVRGRRPPAPAPLKPVRQWLNRWGWWVLFGVCAALAMYTQQLAAFYLLPLGLLGLVSGDRRTRIGVLAGTVLALIMYAPWLVQLPGQLGKVGSYYWIPVPSLARLLLTLRTFVVGGSEPAAPFGLMALGGALLIVIFLGLFVFRALRARRRVDREAVLWTLALFTLPVVLLWGVSQVRPVYLDRALLPSALMFYLLLGWLFTRSALPRPFTVVIGWVAFACALLGLVTHYGWNSFPNSPFPDAAQSIRADWQAGDQVVHQSKLSMLPLVVAERGLAQHYIGDVPGSPEDTLALPTQQVLGLLADACVQTAAGGADRVWFVTWPLTLEQARRIGRTDILAAYDWLNTHYVLSETRTFNDLNVQLFVQPDAEAQAAACPETLS